MFQRHWRGKARIRIFSKWGPSIYKYSIGAVGQQRII